MKNAKPMSKTVQAYCRKHKITWEQECDEFFEFRAPAGSVFSTESSTRLLDTSEMEAFEIKACLRLFPKLDLLTFVL